MEKNFGAKDKRFFAVGILCILAITFLVYFNTLSGFFLSDDLINLFQHRPVSFNDCIRVFADFIEHPFGYRPIWTFSWYFDYLLWGNNPVGYHITNTSLHGLVSVLVFFLTYCISEKKGLSYFTAMLFAVHPIHSGAVAWISCRMDLICAFFYLVALMGLSSFLYRRSVVLYLLSLLAFCTSLLTKEMALSLPLVALVLILIKKGSFLRKKENLREAIKLSLPFFLIAAGYIAFRFLLYGQISIRMVGGRPELSQFFLERGMFKGIYTALRNITLVPFKALLFPFNDLYFGNFGKNSYLVKAGFLLILIAPFLLIVFSDIRKIFNRIIFFGLTFISFSSIPVFHVISENFSNNRYLYLPSVGYCLVAAVVLWLFFEKLRLSRQSKRIGFGLVLIFNTAVLMVNNSVRNVAAEIAYQVPHQIKQMHPTFKESNPILYIHGDLKDIKGIPIYAWGIGDALRLFYPDNPPHAYLIGNRPPGSFEVTGDFDLRTCYTENSYLMFWDSEEKKLEDLTSEFKLRLREGFEEIDPEAYPRWESNDISSSWKLESSHSQLHLISSRISLPLVRIKAIEIKMQIEPDGEKKTERAEILLWFIDQDERRKAGKQRFLSFDLSTDRKLHHYTFPLKILDIRQMNVKLARLELRLPYPQEAVEIEYIQIRPFGKLSEVVFPVWDFKNDFNLWDRREGVDRFDISENSSLLVSGINEAPVIISPRIDIPIEEVDSIKLKMKIIPKAESYLQKGKILWITDTDQIWEEEKKSRLFTIIPDGKFHTYEIPFEPVISEQGNMKLVQLQLIPTSFPAEVEINFIELVSI